MAHYVVYRDEGDRWVCAVGDVGGTQVGDWPPPRSGREAVDLLERSLAGRGETVTSTTQSGGVFHVVSEPRAAEVRLVLPGPAAAALNRVLAETGDKPGEAFGKALGLYLLALDARKRGKVVGAAESAEALDTEFTGF